MSKVLRIFTAAAALALVPPAFAQATSHDSHHPQQAATAPADYTQGEVKKIDKEAGKITLKHGPIRNLDMPGMTMAFRTKDPALLDKVKVGDAVTFKAENSNGQLTVTDLQVAR